MTTTKLTDEEWRKVCGSLLNSKRVYEYREENTRRYVDAVNQVLRKNAQTQK